MIAAPEHDELNEHLNAYLDGELDAALRRRVEAHLQACADCRLELVQLRDTKHTLRALPMLRAPRPFTLEAQPTARPRRPGLLALPWLGWVWRLGSVAAAACVLLALVAGTRGPSMSPTAVLSSKSQSSESQENAPSGSAGSGLTLADRAASQRVAPQNTPPPGAGGAPANAGGPGTRSAFAPASGAAAPAQGTPATQNPAAPQPPAQPAPLLRRQDSAAPPTVPAQSPPEGAVQPRDVGARAAPAVESGGHPLDWRLIWLSAGGTLAAASAAAFAWERRAAR